MLEDFYWDIAICEPRRTPTTSGGYITTWVNVGTFRGLINKKMPNVGITGGKVTETSEYKAMGEYHEELKPENRLLDKGYYYRIKGKPKDCIGLGHHVSIDLDYVGS